jgi:cobalt-zinc-cadmium efflux system outer membrane protein
MRARRLVTLGILAASWTAAAAETSTSSYTVEELQAVARSVHPSLESVEAGVEAATGALRQARAYPNPAFALAGGRGRPRDGGDAGSETLLELSQPIELPGVRKWRIRVAELSLRGAGVERTVAESVVDATVARLAHTVLGRQRRAEIARESERVAERLHELLARRVELGESPPLEAVKARTEWFDRRRDVLDAESALEAVRTALNVFCAGRLGPRYEVVDALDGARDDALPPDLLRRLREDNPLVLRAGVAVEEAEARVGTERKETLPRIDVFAGRETEFDRTATNLGAGLTIPLWNRNRGAIEAAVANRRRAGADAGALLAELESDLVRAVAEYERALAAIRLHGEGWTAAARESLDIATFSYENGEATLLDVLDAQRAYLAVRLAEVESRTALNLARAEIERLIGGPLDTEANDETP